jgi:purine-nucleoside phosphorylase
MKKTIQYLSNKLPEIPKFAIVLGSGLSSITEDFLKTKTIIYSDIPDYPQTSISGHRGEFVFGYLNEIPVLCARGRFHFYEGLSIKEVTIPIRLFSSLKIPNLIITNSAGCVNFNWNVGDIMLIKGHLDFTFRTLPPKISLDKSIYSRKNLNFARNIAKTIDLNLREGIYTWVLGPTYETPAEIREIRKHGGDAVGMSTLPEIIEAGKQNINMWGFTCFTNMAAGMNKGSLKHEDVLLNAEKYKESFKKFICQLIIEYNQKEIL